MVNKIYHRDNLLCSDLDLIYRMDGFKHLSREYGFIATTSFTFKNDIIHYNQQKIVSKPFPLEWCKHHFTSLIKTLEIFEHHELAHGDIVKRNVIFDGEQLYLIDFEPCLKQIKNGVNNLMYTPPYIATEDYLNGILTSKTDKIGFFFLILRLRKVLTPKMISKMFYFHMIQNQSILPMPETILFEQRYDEIFKLATNIQSIDWI